MTLKEDRKEDIHYWHGFKNATTAIISTPQEHWNDFRSWYLTKCMTWSVRCSLSNCHT